VVTFRFGKKSAVGQRSCPRETGGGSREDIRVGVVASETLDRANDGKKEKKFRMKQNVGGVERFPSTTGVKLINQGKKFL